MKKEDRVELTVAMLTVKQVNDEMQRWFHERPCNLPRRKDIEAWRLLLFNARSTLAALLTSMTD